MAASLKLSPQGGQVPASFASQCPSFSSLETLFYFCK